MPPRKKRAPEEDLGDDGDDDVKDDVKVKKKARVKKEKVEAVEEPHIALKGPAWTIHPPYLLYRYLFLLLSMMYPLLDHL